MYCCRHKLSALPSKQMVMMDNTLIKRRLSLADCLKHLNAILVMITLVTTLMTGRESMLYGHNDQLTTDMINVMIMISNQYTLCNTQA